MTVLAPVSADTRTPTLPAIQLFSAPANPNRDRIVCVRITDYARPDPDGALRRRLRELDPTRHPGVDAMHLTLAGASPAQAMARITARLDLPVDRLKVGFSKRLGEPAVWGPSEVLHRVDAPDGASLLQPAGFVPLALIQRGLTLDEARDALAAIGGQPVRKRGDAVDPDRFFTIGEIRTLSPHAAEPRT